MVQLPPEVGKIFDETQGLPAAERIQRLTEEAEAVIAKHRLMAAHSLSESLFSVQVGNNLGSLDLALEDPRFDSGTYPWDEVGLKSGYRPGGAYGLPALRGPIALERARNVGRWLWAENEFAIGAHRLRQSYLVGSGVQWRMVPWNLDAEDEALTEAANEVIRAFVEENRWPLVERETVLRADRDGESFLRLFSNASGPLRVRFIEPENVQQPDWAVTEEIERKLQYGVETAPGDPSHMVAVYIADGPGEPQRVEAVNRLTGLRHIVHVKQGTDMNARRGWPLLWPARRNLSRAEKLMRNMALVAALQASIAIIRKHESATKQEAETFLDANRDLLATNNATGKSTRYRGIDGGLVLDTGPGITYEAPISSVDASNNVEVLRAELRSVASMLNMPESMFTSQIDGSFAGSLVAEAPFVKYMESEQNRLLWDLKAIVRAAVEHEVFWGRLPDRVLRDYQLQAEFPSLEVRDFLKETQKRQIEAQSGVLSVKTWRAKAGYDDAVERRNMAAEPTPMLQTGNIGGGNQTGNTNDPGSAADTNFAQDDAQSRAGAEGSDRARGTAV